MIVPFLSALAPAAAGLHVQCFPEDPWPAEAFIALMGSGAYGFGWVEEKVLTGVILVRDAADEAEILTFAVDPHRRRTGIGTQLILAACMQCESHKINSLFLEVATDNRAALNLYAEVGFEQVGERAGYYRGGQAPIDALIMLKKFPGRCN